MGIEHVALKCLVLQQIENPGRWFSHSDSSIFLRNWTEAHSGRVLEMQLCPNECEYEFIKYYKVFTPSTSSEYPAHKCPLNSLAAQRQNAFQFSHHIVSLSSLS